REGSEAGASNMQNEPNCIQHNPRHHRELTNIAPRQKRTQILPISRLIRFPVIARRALFAILSPCGRGTQHSSVSRTRQSASLCTREDRLVSNAPVAHARSAQELLLEYVR